MARTTGLGPVDEGSNPSSSVLVSRLRNLADAILAQTLNLGVLGSRSIGIHSRKNSDELNGSIVTRVFDTKTLFDLSRSRRSVPIPRPASPVIEKSWCRILRTEKFSSPFTQDHLSPYLLTMFKYGNQLN